MKQMLRLLLGIGVIFQLGMAAKSPGAGSAGNIPPLDLAGLTPEGGDDDDMSEEARGALEGALRDAYESARSSSAATPTSYYVATSRPGTPFELKRNARLPLGRATSGGIGLPPRVPSKTVTPREYPATEDEFLRSLYELLKAVGVSSDCITAIKEASDSEGRLVYTVRFDYGLYRANFFAQRDVDTVSLEERRKIDMFDKQINDAINRLAENTAVTAHVFVLESRVSPAKLSRATSPSSDGRASTPSSGL